MIVIKEFQLFHSLVQSSYLLFIAHTLLTEHFQWRIINPFRNTANWRVTSPFYWWRNWSSKRLYYFPLATIIRLQIPWFVSLQISYSFHLFTLIGSIKSCQKKITLCLGVTSWACDLQRASCLGGPKSDLMLPCFSFEILNNSSVKNLDFVLGPSNCVTGPVCAHMWNILAGYTHKTRFLFHQHGGCYVCIQSGGRVWIFYLKINLPNIFPQNSALRHSFLQVNRRLPQQTVLFILWSHFSQGYTPW